MTCRQPQSKRCHGIMETEMVSPFPRNRWASVKAKSISRKPPNRKEAIPNAARSWKNPEKLLGKYVISSPRSIMTADSTNPVFIPNTNKRQKNSDGTNPPKMSCHQRHFLDKSLPAVHRARQEQMPLTKNTTSM